MDAVTRGRIEEFWALRLGCTAAQIRTPGLHVLQHPDSASLFVLCIDRSVVVAAPAAFHGLLESVRDPLVLADSAALRDLLTPHVARLVGPAYVGYAGRLRPPAEPLAALHHFTDLAAPEIRALRSAVTSEEWLHANLESAAAPIIGVVASGSALSAAGAETLLGRVAHIGVVTDRRHRGRGLGRQVVHAVARHVLTQGLLAQYQTLYSNGPAMRVAQTLGFEHVATTLSVRLRGAAA